MHEGGESGISIGGAALLCFAAFVAGAYFVAWAGFIETFPHHAIAGLLASHEWMGVFVSACAATVSAIAVYFVRSTLMATQQMAINQQRLTEREYQPILHVEKLTSEYLPGANELLLRLDLKNHGKLPAVETEVLIRAYGKRSPDQRRELIWSKSSVYVIIPNDSCSTCKFHVPADNWTDEYRVALLIVSGHGLGITGEATYLPETWFGLRISRLREALDFSCDRVLSDEGEQRIAQRRDQIPQNI